MHLFVNIFLQSKMKAIVQEYMFGTAGDMFPPPVSDRERIAGDVTKLE